MKATHEKKKAFIHELVQKMTPAEKVGQLNQIGTSIYGGDETLFEEDIREGRIGSFLTVRGAKKTNQLQNIAVNESRLGIPLLFADDVIHGYETLFPIPLALSCSWEPELAKEMAEVSAREAAAAGLHWTFSPMMDIGRDPRWGRVAEGYGEDPFLTSRFITEQIIGFQGEAYPGEAYEGEAIDQDRVLACAKHFVGYGAVEGGRDYNAVDMSTSKLFNTHLPPFKAAVEGGVATVMSAFNDFNGIPSTANEFLLKDILRKHLDFNGLVVSDWNAIDECVAHGYAMNRKTAGLCAFQAGIDIDMAAKIYVEELPGLLEAEKVTEKELDEAVGRVLSLKYDLGLFESPTRTTEEKEKQTLCTIENRDKALRIAKECLVLLKNEKEVLPLRDKERILLTGPLAADKEAMVGTWGCNGKAKDVITLYEGLSKVEHVETTYLKNVDEFAGEIDQINMDKIVVVLGETAFESGEAKSKTKIGLGQEQEEVLLRLRGFGKPIILVLMNGRPLDLSAVLPHVEGILVAWHLGTMAGEAIASVLTGEHNPSGKLTMTFPRNAGQIPVYYNHFSTGRPKVEEQFNTSRYLDEENEGLFPFGYGLSYTTFHVQDVSLEKDVLVGEEDELKVSCKVKNTGKRKGKETLQLYLRDHFASQVRPVKELVDFQKIELEPDEEQFVNFVLPVRKLGFYNSDGEYIIEPGTFTIHVGTNSQDTVAKSFTLEGSSN